MWHFEEQRLGTTTHVLRLYEGNAPVDHEGALTLLRTSAAFRAFFSEALVDIPVDSFFFETPAFCDSTKRHSFELAVIATDGFAGLRADPRAFSQHLQKSSGAVAVFENLGRDATLIVPRPVSVSANYLHLAAFLRSAPEEQIGELWRSSAEAMLAKVTGTPKWMSTAGLGVSWLHVRIDSTPKYYRFDRYKNKPIG